MLDQSGLDWSSMMVLGKLKEFIMNYIISTVCVFISFVTLVISICYYNYSEMKSLERNIESAIVKGIDPVAVRCAYADQRDVICVAYAASSKNTVSAPAAPALQTTKK